MSSKRSGGYPCKYTCNMILRASPLHLQLSNTGSQRAHPVNYAQHWQIGQRPTSHHPADIPAATAAPACDALGAMLACFRPVDLQLYLSYNDSYSQVGKLPRTVGHTRPCISSGALHLQMNVTYNRRELLPHPRTSFVPRIYVPVVK